MHREAAKGWPNLKKGLASEAAKGYPVLEKARAAQAANGWQSLKAAHDAYLRKVALRDEELLRTDPAKLARLLKRRASNQRRKEARLAETVELAEQVKQWKP